MIIDTPALDVFEHMAADEIMCQDLPDPFILRFFKWVGRGAGTFGYSQRYHEVVSLLGRPGMPESRFAPQTARDYFVVRRPTGGGLVFHDRDITFSCIFEMPGVLSPGEIYARIHGAVHGGLKSMGIDSTLWQTHNREVPSKKCFVRPVPMDIVAGGGNGRTGSKILGGALRRFEDHVLYQGSLQIPPEAEAGNGAGNREKEFHSAISGALALEWSLKWTRRELSDGVVTRIRALAGTKYRSEEWNKRI